jgi:excisionase family DNA binding protein
VFLVSYLVHPEVTCSCTTIVQKMNEQEHAGKGGMLPREAVQPEWISYPEAERYSGLSHTTLWRYIGSGELKAARVGRSLRLHLPTLRSFMEERACGAPR